MTPSPRLRQATLGDCMVILDLSRGDYILLDQIASAIWRGLVGPTQTEAALTASLRVRFNVSEDRLLADIGAFRQRCGSEGLLVEAGTQPLASPVRRSPRKIACPTLAAWLWLAASERRLRRQGFARAYELAVDQAPDVHGDADAGRLAQAEAAFARAENLFISRAAPQDCLPRSLALHGFLRAMGLPAEHHIGCEHHPFSAHAWVECGGRVILDVDRRASLTTLSALAA
jgi:hypothetical protein